MENTNSTLYQWIVDAYHLLKRLRQEVKKIKPLIFQSELIKMLQKLFEATEAMLRAAIYLLILIMGVAITTLGAYTIIFLALRIGQFFWVLILKEKWL